MSTLNDIIFSVRNRVNINENDGRMSDALFRDFINHAMQDAEQEFNWPWREAIQTISVVADDNEYAVPADFQSTLSLTMVDPPMVLVRKSWKWTRRLAHLDLRAIPCFYTEYSGNLYIYPIPDSAYTLQHRYVTTVDRLEETTDELVSPEWFDRVIVSRASMYVADKLRDSEHHQMFKQAYNEQIKQAKDDVSSSAEPIQIDTRRDW
jgi:hypothetical protein